MFLWSITYVQLPHLYTYWDDLRGTVYLTLHDLLKVIAESPSPGFVHQLKDAYIIATGNKSNIMVYIPYSSSVFIVHHLVLVAFSFVLAKKLTFNLTTSKIKTKLQMQLLLYNN